MMKKFLFSFLAVLVGACWFGGISSADEIEAIGVTWVTYPTSWTKVSSAIGINMPTYVHALSELYVFDGVSFQIQDWENWNNLADDYKFVLGQTYRIKLGLYLIDSGVNSFSGTLTCSINWDDCDTTIDSDGDNRRFIYKTFTAGEPNYTLIDSVGFTDVIFPVSWTSYTKAYLEMSRAHLLSDTYDNLNWYFHVLSWDEWVLMTEDDIFVKGSWYKLNYIIDLKDKINYAFSDELTWTINGEYFDDIAVSGDQRILSKEFTVLNKIDSVSVSNVVLPTAWKTTDDLWNSPTSLTYWGDYVMVWTWYYVWSWDEWNWDWEWSFQYWKKYNVVITLWASGARDIFNPSITDSNISINGGEWKLESLQDDNTIIQISKEVTLVETTPTQTPVAWWGSSWGYSRSSTPSTNTEIKKVEQTGDALIYSWTNELIPVDYLKEELEKNKELYKNAPIKVMVALLNLTRADLFRLKNTAEDYKKATPEIKQNVLAVLNWLANDNSKRAKYVSDYFKFLVGIE